MTDEQTWTPLPVTDEQLRAVGLPPEARNRPYSRAAAEWVAAKNNLIFGNMPVAFYYASSPLVHEYIEKQASMGKSAASIISGQEIMEVITSALEPLALCQNPDINAKAVMDALHREGYEIVKKQ